MDLMESSDLEPDTIPTEIWQEIMERCKPDDLHSFQMTSHHFSSLLPDSLWERRCLKEGSHLSQEYRDIINEHSDELQLLDFAKVYHYDPFRSNVGSYCSTTSTLLSPAVLESHMTGKGQVVLGALECFGPAEQGARATRRFEINFSDIGVPGWLMDAARPRVSLLLKAYRMPASDGDILVSARLLRSGQTEGTSGVCRKEHQGWFLAGWHSPAYPMEEFVEMDFEVYSSGARMLVIEASCSGGGRLADVEVRLHFPPVPPADFGRILGEYVEGRRRQLTGPETAPVDQELEVAVDMEEEEDAPEPRGHILEAAPSSYSAECRILIGLSRESSRISLPSNRSEEDEVEGDFESNDEAPAAIVRLPSEEFSEVVFTL